jgi:general secretion pathway protein B
MSYILEALKKADRERTLGEVPDLESAHWGVRRPQRSWRWLWIVVVLLLFNAVLLGYLLSRDEVDMEQVAGTAPVTPPVVVSPPVPASQPAAQARVEPPPPVAIRPKVAVRPQIAARPVIKVTPEPDPAPPARVVQAQVPLTAAPGAAETELPEWSELSLEFRSGFMLPHVDVHVYAEQPRRRFILVDLEKYREGDTLKSGAVLEKIHPNSIQLYYQGTRFRVDR